MAEYKCCETEFFIHIVVIVFLVVFAGLMSGLTLGLMSLSLVDLEVLAESGTPKDKKYIIPQSVCSRYGLAIGATVAPVVRILVWICFPVGYPISKLLDLLLSDGHRALFRRAELKMLVNFHGNEAGKGGELTHDETTIIAGALELSKKTASDAMTPISEIFSIDINAKLDRFLINLILEKGHSRVPVYYEQPTNIIGLVLVKNLLTINPDEEVPVKSVAIRRIPRVPETMPLYDILNEFQKGHSHMPVVIKLCKKMVDAVASTGSLESNRNVDNKLCLLAEVLPYGMFDTTKVVRIEIDGGKSKSKKMNRPMKRWKSFPNSPYTPSPRSRKWMKDMYLDILQINGNPLPTLPEEEAVGILTMEDVIEELLQEEIFDETDHHAEDS